MLKLISMRNLLEKLAWLVNFDDFLDFLGKSYLNSNKKVAENGKILLKNSKTKVGATCKLVNLRYY